MTKNSATVVAVFGGTELSVARLENDEFETLKKRHPELTGIPVYWRPFGFGFQVWPLPSENIVVKMLPHESRECGQRWHPGSHL